MKKPKEIFVQRDAFLPIQRFYIASFFCVGFYWSVRFMLSKLLCLVSFSDHRVKSHNKWKVSFWKRSIKHTNEQNRERRSDRTIKWTREGIDEKKTSRERRASEMMDRRLNELRELIDARTHERIGQNTRTDGRTGWWWNVFILRNAQY